MVEPLRHRQTKGAETDMPGLPPPRHIPTLPSAALEGLHLALFNLAIDSKLRARQEINAQFGGSVFGEMV